MLKGRWHYLEHDWVAEQGGYVYEPPGETHTLVVPEDVEEMITLFQVNGIMLYVDPDGNALGYEDVFSRSRCVASTTRSAASEPITWSGSFADTDWPAMRRSPSAVLPVERDYEVRDLRRSVEPTPGCPSAVWNGSGPLLPD